MNTLNICPSLDQLLPPSTGEKSWMFHQWLFQGITWENHSQDQNEDRHLGRLHLLFYPRVGVLKTTNPHLATINMIIVLHLDP